MCDCVLGRKIVRSVEKEAIKKEENAIRFRSESEKYESGVSDDGD